MNSPARREGPLDRILRDYESVEAALSEAVTPAPARRAAADALCSLGWPSVRDEQWRYANLRAFERLNGFRPARLPDSDATHAAAPATLQLPAELAGFERWLFIDGVRHGAAMRPGASLAPSVTRWEAEQRFGLLTDMFATDIAHVQVHGKAAIELLFVTTEAAAGAAVYPRIQLQLSPGSELQLIERHLGGASAPSLLSAAISIELGRDARLCHYRLQQCGPQVLFSDTLSAELAANASYQVRHIALGAASARTSALVRLAGHEARVSWQALAVGRGEQVHDTALKVEHAASATRTEEVFRGIAEERARIAFGGHILIHPGADGSDARQSLRGLIEGAGAEIDLRPRLEINTDEVSAQHGATTGQLDDNLLFYLLSRGLDRDSARSLLKWAFLGDVLRSIELPALRSVAEQGAAGLLPDVLAAGAVSQ